VWLEYLWFTDKRVRGDEQRDVVLCLRSEHVVCVRAAGEGVDDKATFFPDLTRSTLFDGLAELQVTTGKSPRACTVRALSLAQ
jgi:hypothetical protein